MELKEMTIEQLEERKAELVAEIDGCEEMEKLNELRTNIEAIKAEMESRAQIEAEKAEIRSAIANNEVPVVEVQTFTEERSEVKDMVEVRNSKEYVDAYANYIKTGNAEEVRSLLTTNVSGGTVAVPDFVYDEIKTAWDANDIMSLVRKIEVQGNMKVQFEISGSDAVIHTEGGDPVTEETLSLGIVTLVPASIKKWIGISDEALDMRGEAFLRYIYAELTKKIVDKLADTLITKIAALPATVPNTKDKVSAATIKVAPAMGTVATAIANLSDEARNPVIVMNKLTYANFKAIQYANGYGADPFEGLRVVFSSVLDAYDSASEDDVYMIVGDFGQGALANFPNGDGVEIKVDDKTKMTEDIVRILGREYVAAEPVACKAFTLVSKPAEG
jgi:HK97 family phage major capsid protein